MTDRPPPRRPAAFRLDDPAVTVSDEAPTTRRAPASGSVRIVPERETVALPTPYTPRRPRFTLRWGRLLWTSLGVLVVMGMGLSFARMISELLDSNELVGLIALGFGVLAVIGLVGLIVREAAGLARLARIEQLHRRADGVYATDDSREARSLVRDLVSFTRANPRLAQARATLDGHSGDIIDGIDYVKVAERELMGPLDREARRLVSQAAQRVSLVTAVSPRAAIDMLFVFYSGIRLVRQLAQLYGARPGALGMIELMKMALKHLAITGGMAAGDSLVQQMLGQGLAAKVSARLGEGVLNGLLTARLGLAAIDVTRPLPFRALPRPALADLVNDLIRRVPTEPGKIADARADADRVDLNAELTDALEAIERKPQGTVPPRNPF